MSRKIHPKIAWSHWWFPLRIFFNSGLKEFSKTTIQCQQMKSLETFQPKTRRCALSNLQHWSHLAELKPPILQLSKQNTQPVTNIWRSQLEDSHPFQSSGIFGQSCIDVNPGRPWNKTSSDEFFMELSHLCDDESCVMMVAAHWIPLWLNAVPNTKSSPGTWVISRTWNHLPPEWLWFRPWAIFWIFNSKPGSCSRPWVLSLISGLFIFSKTLNPP